MNTKPTFFTSFFYKKYSEFNISASLTKLRYLPNWVILLLDVCIVLFSVLVTFVLFKALKLNYILPQHLFVGVLYYLVVNIFFFWYFKTYSGIIRHSSIVDALYLFYSQSLTFIVLILSNYVLMYYGYGKLVLTTASLFNALLSLILLFLFRITVKQFFQQFFSVDRNNHTLTAVIYGIDSNSIAVANALQIESPRRFTLLGFVDVKNENTSKRILNLPILKYQRSLPVTMRILHAEAVIIADSSLSAADQSKILEKSIDFNFKLFRAPILNASADTKIISRAVKSFEISDLLGRKPIVLDTEVIATKISEKVIFITGAAGSIGSEITRQVLQFKPTVVVLLDQAESPLHDLGLELEKAMKGVCVESVVADVRRMEVIAPIFEKYHPHIVFHAAAYKHVPLMELNPAQAIYTNIVGTKNVADLSLQFGVERFVMISTDKAVNPSSVMGASKRIAEMYVQSLHNKHSGDRAKSITKFITTRFGNVLGSNGSVVPLFTKQIRQGGPVTITHPDVIRYFMTIPEACQLVLEACSMGLGGEIYIFDMGEPIKIMDLAKKMIRLAGFIPEKDIVIQTIGLRPGEKLYEELLNDTSTTLPTHHEKIMIAEEAYADSILISNAIAQLVVAADLNNSDTIVVLMKKIVPEYKSLNSVFQHFD